MSFFSKSKFIFIFLFLFSSVIFLLHYYVVGQAVYGDGIYYYSYSHSLYFDQNINLRNELGHHYSPKSNNSFQEEPLETVREKTKTGFAPSKYPIGPSLAWIPAIYISDQIANVINIFDKTFPTNGYSNIYQITVGILNTVFVILGLFILYKFLNKIFKPFISLFTIICIFSASNLFYYGSIDVINSHPLSFLLATVFLFLWYKTFNKRGYFEWFLLGIIIGALALSRTQDFIFLTVILADNIFYIFNNRHKIITLKTLFIGNLLLALGIIIAFSPQLLSWQIMYGDFFHMPYTAGSEGFNLVKPHIINVLINQKTGLFIWTPIYAFMIFGLFILFKKNRLLSLYSLMIFTIQFYLISSWSGWSQGESFSIRMLISTLPFLSLGLASFFEVMLRKFGQITLIIFFTLLVLINFYSILNFMIFSKSPTYDRGVNTRKIIIQKINRDFKIIP